MKLKLQKLLKENLLNFKLGNEFGHRSVGDKIESDCSFIAKKFFDSNYIQAKSKRSIEDFKLTSTDCTIFLDVKTHFIQDEGFSMPNLISIKRLNKLLQDDTNELAYIFVDYKRHDGKVMIENIIIKYIWELDWSILRIGALGKGQLQIKDANQQLKFTNIGRKKWIERLKNEAISFYETELNKTKKEIKFWKK